MNSTLFTILALGVVCKSPPAEVKAPDLSALGSRVKVEGHSCNHRRLSTLQPGEPNSAKTRAIALESHRTCLETEFMAEAEERGLVVDQRAQLCLELAITNLGEVRA